MGDEEGIKEATGKEDSGEVKPAKKMRKMEGCTIYSSKEEEAEEAKKKVVLVKKKKKRCALDSCQTRLGLTAYQCRCGRMFCPLHTPAEEHACDFDYQGEAREQIEEGNPKVVAEKVRKL